MRQLIVAAVLSVAGIMVAPASGIAGAIQDTRTLYQAVLTSGEAFTIALEEMESSPAKAASRLESEVHRPLVQASAQWWDALHASDDRAAYHSYIQCWSAANVMDEVAGKLIRFLEGNAERPDVSTDVDQIHDDLAHCESALGVAD